MLKRLSTIICWVSDMERSVSFYRDVCGLTARSISPQWSDFDLGNGVTLGLHPAGARGQEASGGGWTIGFDVDRIADVKARLEAAEATIHGDYHDIPGGVILDFEDPDGHALEAMQLGITAEGLTRQKERGSV